MTGHRRFAPSRTHAAVVCVFAAVALQGARVDAAAPGSPPPAPAAAMQKATRVVAGVSIPERMELESQPLVLNGAAVRKVVIIKVYVASLYLPARESRAETILAADQPRVLTMHFLHDVGTARLCGGWDEGLAANTPDPSAALKEQFRILCSFMEDTRSGDLIGFRYVPGKGTTVDVHGKTKGPIAGKEFADALFRSWLGPKPGPGEEFKRNLLGLD
jgi:hypothetical protein